jgi:predicted small secreted protein
MKPSASSVALILLAFVTVVSTGCATMGGAGEESEPTMIDPCRILRTGSDDSQAPVAESRRRMKVSFRWP